MQDKRLTLTYGLDDAIEFNEIFTFDFPYVDFDADMLNRAIQNLFFMAGVSYFKAYLPPEISVETGELDQYSADFFSETYSQGLGEFFYVNSLDPYQAIVFPTTVKELVPIDTSVSEGMLIGLGGGKDSLVSVELLRNQPRIATWSLGHELKLQPLVQKTGLLHYTVQREIDSQILQLNDDGAYNGHVPISAIIACVGNIVGILAGYNQVVVSNENSANEATLEYRGRSINHQYSKSLAFEQNYQSLLKHGFGDAINYYSILRPLSELAIAQLFAQKCFDTYKDVFSSCNKAFTSASDDLYWCGNCPKCAFVFLALTPFVGQMKLRRLWDGDNLLFDPTLEPTYRHLLGIEGNKPLECVGEIRESRFAMHLAQELYTELKKYEFELDTSYDYTYLHAHSMPEKSYLLLKDAIKSILV